MISERIVLLAVLTAGMYGLSIYMQDGAFILPFGLYKLGLFIIAVILLIANRKKPALLDVLLLLWTASLAISSRFVLQLFYSGNDFELEVDSLTRLSSTFFLAFVLFLFTWQVVLAFQDDTRYRWLQIANASAMMICLLLNMFEWFVVPTWMWLLTVFLNRAENPMHKSMVGLFGFVILSAWCSALYYGKEVILMNL